MNWPPVDESTLKSVATVLRSGRLSVSWRPNCGSESVERTLAREFASVYGCPTAVAVDHGTSGLVVALEALGVEPGDEVIVPAVTWVAPATAVLRAGAVPILADVDPVTGCISAETANAVVSRRTVGIIVVHLTGYAAEMGAVIALCNKIGLWCVEDCSQAHLCEWNNEKVGTLGDIGVLSLGAAKQIPAGEGGIVLSRHPGLQTTLEQLRADSRRSGAKSIYCEDTRLIEDGSSFGTNYCMSELSAAVGLDQLAKYLEVIGLVKARMESLSEYLMESSFLTGMSRSDWETNQVCYEYPLRLLRTDKFDANAIVDRLRAVGVDAYRARDPLFCSKLFSPETHPQFRSRAALCAGNSTSGYPGAVSYSQQTVLFHHSAFQLDSAPYERFVKSFSALGSDLCGSRPGRRE